MGAVYHASSLVNRSPSKYLDFKCAEEDVVFDEKTMLMIKIKKPEANDDVVSMKIAVNISPRSVLGYSKNAAN
ncbi:unnamed protein product [Prunus armeniaca]